VRYEALLSAWRGEWGGAEAAEAYRGFVEAGLSNPPSSPFCDTFQIRGDGLMALGNLDRLVDLDLGSSGVIDAKLGFLALTRPSATRSWRSGTDP
jgi:hypothetical protein